MGSSNREQEPLPGDAGGRRVQSVPFITLPFKLLPPLAPGLNATRPERTGT